MLRAIMEVCFSFVAHERVENKVFFDVFSKRRLQNRGQEGIRLHYSGTAWGQPREDYKGLEW